jgi:hypothetical protein
MTGGAFLIPQTVFAGDEGRYVSPLPEEIASLVTGSIVITDRARLPANENVMVTCAAIDGRTKQVMIDFMAFKPGAVEIPEITLGPVELPAFTVHIASILEQDGYSITLSPPEKPLAAPGTFALIIGGATAVITLTALAVFLVVSGPRHFQILFEKIRVWMLTWKTKRAILKTRNALHRGRIEAKESIAVVSEVFKTFFSALYRQNYSSYSAEDFLTDKLFAGGAVYLIFATCDKLKFSAIPVGRDDAAAVIERTLSYIKG